MSALVCLGRRTVTGMIGASGRQFVDWSGDYRLFSRPGRFRADRLFDVVRTTLVSELDKEAPLVVAIDDSHLPKTGKKTFGVSWRRDPHKPHFMTGFMRAQRILQISAAIPSASGPAGARMIPIDFSHAPTPQKPRASSAPTAWANYRKQKELTNISRTGAKRISRLREALDQEQQAKRDLIVTADGQFTNGTVLKNLPERTTLIGRVRKDTRLHFLPKAKVRGRGRAPSYGAPAPTPEALLRDSSIAWRRETVWAAGRTHECRFKTLAPLRWRAAGQEHDLRLIVIAPLAYRPKKGSRLLYREPAYLIATDPNLSIADLIQSYVWRWDIEVNFRDEKQLLGVGQAQVRNAPSVESVPQLIVAAYAMLLLSAHRVFGAGGVPELLPAPKWRRGTPRRASTQSLINHLRAELWGQALGVNNFSGFASGDTGHPKPEKLLPHLSSAVLYAA